MDRIETRKRWNGLRKGAGWLDLAVLAAGMICLTPVVRGDDGAPGGRAARLSYVEGSVRITQGNQVLAEQATINTPLFEGMQLSTTDQGRAEIQFEDGSVARISPDTTLTLTALRGQGESGDAEMTLNGGLAYFELQGSNQSGQMSVHFGDTVATADGFTVLRVRMDAPPGEVAVFSGNAHLEGSSGALMMDLHGGESVALMASDPAHSVISESIEPDSWDAWNSDRDQALNAQAGSQTEAANSISPDESQNPAWSDLDANGNWYNVPGQGYVWSPYDAANPGWDPYGNGNWMWTPTYGYIWASGYPWGYLPYQCGAWNFYNGFGWGWAPGFGGCQPWWLIGGGGGGGVGGGYYTGPRFGFLPGGYRMPNRPVLPHPPGRGHPVPVISVNHHMGHGDSGAFPLRERNTPVTIAGSSLLPLHPLPMHSGFRRPSAEFAQHEAQIYGNPGRGPNSLPAPTPRPVFGPGRGAYQPGSRPGAFGGASGGPRDNAPPVARTPSPGVQPGRTGIGAGGGFHGGNNAPTGGGFHNSAPSGGAGSHGGGAPSPGGGGFHGGGAPGPGGGGFHGGGAPAGGGGGGHR